MHLTPTQIGVSERQRADALARDLERHLRDSGRDLRDRLLARRKPFIVGLDEGDVDGRPCGQSETGRNCL
jgi:hypothetical protein